MSFDVTKVGMAADVAAIGTALVAFGGYLFYRLERMGNRHRLEAYLKDEKHKGGDQGLRTSLHLMARLGLTEDEILQASARSNKIIRKIAADVNVGRADAILFGYKK